MSNLPLKTILAGGETDLPADTPSQHIDTTGEFEFVGALSISNGSGSFFGSGVALSRDWVLTAGHNADLNDDGHPDAVWSATFNLPGLGSFGIAQAVIHPDFTGFANPFVNDDLALLRLSTPLPDTISLPRFGLPANAGDVITLVGFGRSGYGSYGYTTQASLSVRRSGGNAIDSFSLDDGGAGTNEVFHYDFDSPSTAGLVGGSLGNDKETIIGPGDSGGPALAQTDTGWDVVGINTYTEGYGGLFGDIGGGVLTAPYKDWIAQTTGIPEPGTGTLILIAFLIALLVRKWRRCSRVLRAFSGGLNRGQSPVRYRTRNSTPPSNPSAR